MTLRPAERTHWQVLLVALALAMISAATLWSRTFLEFTGVRQKLLQEPVAAVQGDVRFTLPESPRFARMAPPIVLIVRPHNRSSQPFTIDVALNGARIDAIPLAAGQDRRVDLVIPGKRPIKAGDVIAFTAATGAAAGPGSAAAWSLDYLEVANHHGSSRAILTFFIVPRDTDAYDAPGILLTAIATITIAFLVLRGWPLRLRRRAVIAQIVAMALVVLIFGAVLAAGVVTPYKLLLTPKAFLLCALVLIWPGLVRSYVDLRAWIGARSKDGRAVLDGTIAALLVALFYISLMQVLLADYQGNYSGFLQIGKDHEQHVPFLEQRPDLTSQLLIGEGGGYDGQFMYIMTFDPFLLAFKDDPVRYRGVVDAPPYRYGRIGYSLLTKLLSGDRPALYPITMVWTIIAATALGALLLAVIARDHGQSAAWGLLYVLVPGFVQSLHVGLPESIAAVGLLAGYWLMTRRHLALAAIGFAGSLLVRETGIIFIVAVVIWQAWRARDRRAAIVLASSLLPFIAWKAYVGWRLFPDFGWEGVFFNPRNTGVPLAGILDLWQRVFTGRYYHGAADLAAAGTFFPLLLIVAFAAGLYLLWTRRDGLSAAIVVYGLLAVSLNYTAIWVHVGNGERGTYELFLLLIVAFLTTPSEERTSRRLIGGVMVCTALYLWFASVDAGLVRYALMS